MQEEIEQLYSKLRESVTPRLCPTDWYDMSHAMFHPLRNLLTLELAEAIKTELYNE